jgi:AraC-like DNA-binding protein
MKPQFESVTFPKGCSVRVYHRRVEEIPFEWHHHPEYELTLTLNSRGWRFIGDHIGKYRSPDLALVPSDMPHTWASTATLRQNEPHTAIVIWFSGHWALQLAQVCPEYAPIRRLLRNAATGLEFPRATAKRVLDRLEHILSESPQMRLHATLDLLVALAEVDAVNLSKTAMTVPTAADSEPAQFTRVLQHLHRQFQEPIRIDALCDVGNISARSLHRLFVKHTGDSVSEYLCKLRIGRACMRLAETDLPVSMIAYEVGLSNLANFNRQFRRVRQMTPSAYRRSFKQHTLSPEKTTREELQIRPRSLESSPTGTFPQAVTINAGGLHTRPHRQTSLPSRPRKRATT